MRPAIEAGNTIERGSPCYHIGEVREDKAHLANHVAIETPIGMIASGDCPKTQTHIELVVDTYEVGFIDGSMHFVQGKLIKGRMMQKQRGALSQGYVPGKPRKLGFTLRKAGPFEIWTSLQDCLTKMKDGDSVNIPNDLFAMSSFFTTAGNVGRVVGAKFTLNADGEDWIITRSKKDAKLPVGRPGTSEGGSADLRHMLVGDTVTIQCEPSRVQSIRVTANRLSRNDGTAYTVSATSTGCTVTRTS